MHAECIVSCSEFLTINSREGYELCKTEVDKKQKYTEKFNEFLTDLNASRDESISLIEQDYSALKLLIVSNLDASRNRQCKKAEALCALKAADIENAIQKISHLKEFSEIENSQKVKAETLRKEVESCTVADEALFHSMYNCVNIFVHEAKLAKSCTQDIEDARRQFKSKKFEMLCKVFQDFEQVQTDDLKKLGETIAEFYDQRKKSDVKRLFKEKIDKVFTKNLEVQQMDTKNPQEQSQVATSKLIAPIKHNPMALMHTSEPLINMVLKMSNELGTIIDSSRAHGIASIPAVAAMLSEEVQKRKAKKMAQEKKERIAKEVQLKEKQAKKDELEKSRSKPKGTKYDIFGDVTTEADGFRLYKGNQEADDKPSLIQMAKSIITDHKLATKSSKADNLTSDKEAVVDKLLSKLNQVTKGAQLSSQSTKKFERLSDLVTKQKPSVDIYEAVYGLKQNKLDATVAVQKVKQSEDATPATNDLKINAKEQNNVAKENDQRDRRPCIESHKENTTGLELREEPKDRNWNDENHQRNYNRRNHDYKHQSHNRDHHHSHQFPQNRINQNVQNFSRNKDQDDNAMKVIQTFVVERDDGSRNTQKQDLYHNINLSKRAPEIRGRRDDRQDEIYFRTEESSVLQPIRGNIQAATKPEGNLKITPDCKVLQYKLNRSKKDAMSHANHSEFQLSKGNSFYFTGSEPSDFIEVVLQKEAFISTLLIEPPKLSSDFSKNLSKINGAYVYVQKNSRWERLTAVEFKDQKQVILPVNMRASVFRIAHGNKIDENTALGVGKLIVMG
jgi:hypothetical protein